jgi:hypothetical protein
MLERKNKSSKQLWRPSLNKVDFKPLRTKKMLSKLPLKLKFKDKRMRRRLLSKLLKPRDLELKKLLPRLRRRDSKLSLMLKRPD